MKVEFLKPRFSGLRFEESTLPVDVARDLAAYEELVVELAKHLYRVDHPKRQRVPRGFEQSFNLHIEQVQPGSAKPVLAWVTAGLLALQGTNDYFQRARNLIADCVSASAANQPLPEGFPKQLLDYFNVFGRSLHEGESVDIAAPSQPSAVLTPERRKALVLAGQKVYTRQVELAGLIGETDWEKETFRLRLSDGTAVIAPLPEAFGDLARAAGGKERTLMVVKGIGVFDAWDRLQKLSETHHMDILPNYPLAFQIEKLAALRDGWYEGEGNAPEKDHLAWLTDNLLSTFPEDVPLPLVTASPEGGLFLEWVRDPWRISAEFERDAQRCELHALNTETGQSQEKEIDVESGDQWEAIYDFTRQFK